jgi:hypothetical protein
MEVLGTNVWSVKELEVWPFEVRIRQIHGKNNNSQGA